MNPCDLQKSQATRLEKFQPFSQMNPLQPFLQQNGFLILDGALATELERRGANLKDPLWSAKLLLEAPELVRQVHFDYFKAGADLVITASYQATFEGFAKRGIGEEPAKKLFRRSVELACRARDEFWGTASNRKGRLKPLVAASVGPYGAFLADGAEYRGDYGLTIQELWQFHQPRMCVLADSGADLLAFETIPCLAEAKALLRGLTTLPNTVAYLSFSCKDETNISEGTPFADAVALANDTEQIIAVGLNCTAPQFVEPLLQKAAAVTDKPLLVYPNSGEIWNADSHCWWLGHAKVPFGEMAKQWYAAGARLIGGCCRTGPEDIEQIRAILSNS